MVTNKVLMYVKQPNDEVREGEHIAVQADVFDLDQDAPDGGVIVKINYASFDPYLRTRMKPAEKDDYVQVFALGKPVVNFCITTVVKSRRQGFKQGDLAWIPDCPIAEYATITGPHLDHGYKVDNPYHLSPTVFLGVLGMSGLTAYSSFYDIGQPKRGETIFISAASGAVGQLVGQLAKREGLRVIGSVGDQEKLNFITSRLGFDSGFNYKQETPAAALSRLAPDGIDIYYENVGGEHLEAAIDALHLRGRIVGCGQISEYNKAPEERYGIRNTYLIVRKRITMRGFIVTDEDMGGKYSEEHQRNVQKWIADGSLHVQESLTRGIDNAAKCFLSLFTGNNFGKVILEVAPLET